MQILINENNVAIEKGNNIILSNIVKIDNKVFPDLDPTNCRNITVQNLPADGFIGGKYLYIDEEWLPNPLFIQTPVVSNSPIRSLKRYWFTLRFTLQEQAAINLSTDGIVTSFRELLKMVPEDIVNLDDPLLIQALDYFVSVGILQSNRIQALLEDASGREII